MKKEARVAIAVVLISLAGCKVAKWLRLFEW